MFPSSNVSVLAGLLLVFLLLAFVVRWFLFLVVAPMRDSLRHLPGPEHSFFGSHIKEIVHPDEYYSQNMFDYWKNKYGMTYRFQGFGRFDYRLMTSDPRSLHHILTSDTYEKPWQTRAILSRRLGQGISATEGEVHKIQRRIIGPAFTAAAINEMIPVFVLKAEELRDRWTNMMGSLPSTTLDVSHWTSRATFDVIGLSGFDYQFQSLEHETEPVYRAYRTMFNLTDKGPGFREMLYVHLGASWLEKIWPDEITRSLAFIRKAGARLIAEKKAVILAEKATGKRADKDILSLLLKSNLSHDPSKRLSDSDLLDQLSTFLFAGSDSTALSISWFLHSLSLNTTFQTRLRDEITAVTQENPSALYDPATLDKLPFLDACVRETFRVSPPIHSTIRVATVDDRIPISQAVPLRDGMVSGADGLGTEYVLIKKGSFIHIPIEGINLSPDVWGPDAREFNPERWLSKTAPPPPTPMTFSFGPASCPGTRFSTVEMKIFVAILIQSFVFAPADGIKINKFNAIFTRPYVDDKWEEGSQLPMRISRV